MKYQESYKKFKDYKLPPIGEVFSHPTNPNVKFKLIELAPETGIVETVKSGQRVERTLHWIRKHYGKKP